MKKIIILILFFAAFLVLAQAGEEKRKMTTVDGKVLHMSKTAKGLVFDEYKGKILFVEIYGHRCPYCIKAIDPYNALQEKYKDKLAIVSVEVGGYDEAQLKNFDELYGVEYTNISQKEAGELVPYVSRIGSYRGMIPFLAIFDKKGDFYTSASGPISTAKLESIINELSK
jgi:thiol-disulfide isomerase/thioredoxin